MLNTERKSVRAPSEKRILRMDGSEVWVETLGEPIVYGGKNGGLVFLRDISWRKEAERSLADSEERFRSIFRDSLSVMFLLDPETGRFLDVNTACERFYGWPREELLEMRSQDINLMGEKSIFEMKKAVFEEQTHFEFKHRLADGSVRDVEVYTSRIFIRGKCLLYCIVNDVTAKKSAQRQARLLGRAVEQNSESIIITDAGGNIEYVNPAFTASTGYTAEEAIGKNPRILKSGKQDEPFYRNLWRTLLSGETWKGELHNRKKNGELFWENVVISPILDESGAISHFIAIKEDITEKKKLVESLVLAKEKAEESDRLKTAFLQNVSHEIRTPMNGILGFLALLDEPALEEDEKSEYIRIVNESGQRLLRTINDIIEVSRIEAGRTMLQMEAVDVEGLMCFHRDFFSPQAAEKGLSLTLAEHVRGEDAMLQTDRQKLDSVMNNIMGNAIKFTRRGTVEFGNRVEGDELVFYVQDSGSGIPEDRMEVVFERFVHADPGTARSHDGAGLGLTIAKANVESLGGRIWVSSEVGKGSTFSFSIPYLPLKTPSGCSESGFEPCSGRAGQSDFLVLVAEDDPVSFHFVQTILKKERCTLLHALDGREALNVMRDNSGISLVLMDLKMPGMDGLEATRKIRSFNTNVPIIAQTAYAFPDDRKKALEAGCDDYIAKPVDRTLLIKLIRRYCGRREG